MSLAGLELAAILPPLLLQCWDHKCTSPCWLYLFSYWRHIRRLLLVAEHWRFSVVVTQLPTVWHILPTSGYLNSSNNSFLGGGDMAQMAGRLLSMPEALGTVAHTCNRLSSPRRRRRRRQCHLGYLASWRPHGTLSLKRNKTGPIS